MKYRITAPDFVAAHRLAAGARPWYIGACVLILALIVTCLLPASKVQDGLDWLASGITMALLLGITLYQLTIGQKRSLLKIYEQQASLHEELYMTLDETAVHWTSASGSFSLKWKDVYRFKENDRIILIYQSQALTHIVCRSAFTDAAQLDAFRTLLGSAGGHQAA